MKFDIIYYLTIACPTVKKTLDMLDQYVQHGVTNIQIDMPSHDPFGESDFVKGMMANALRQEENYSYYMDVIRGIRKKYPSLKISVVVYPDVIAAIGVETYAAFLQEINAQQNMVAGEMPEALRAMDARGISYFGNISYSDPDYDIEQYRQSGPEKPLCMRTKRKTDTLNRKYDTWEKRVKHVREGGVQATLYAVAEIETEQQMLERKQAGMDGAIVGNSLMRLWDSPDALWALLDAFEHCRET